MREQLKQIIIMTRGLSAWDELIKTEADIRKKRQNMIYAQQERRQEIMNIVAIILLLIGLSGIIIGVIYLVMMDRGMV
jgi:hypothetical protein